MAKPITVSARIAVLAGALGLGACAVVPPSGPSLLATPQEGKNPDQFQQEEGNCRNYASAHIGYGTSQEGANQAAVGSAVAGSAVGGHNAQASRYALQPLYDQAYAQCMASAGNRVEPGYGYGPRASFGIVRRPHHRHWRRW